MREALRLAAGLLAALTVACAGAATTDTPYTVGAGPEARSYMVSRPDSCTTACPLVLDLHGFGGSGASQRWHSGLHENAVLNGYLVVFPDGVRWGWNSRGNPLGPCCSASSNRIDDVAFLKDVVERVAAAYPVDRTRVYVTGISNGCMMAQRVVAEAADVFAAASCASGYLQTNQKSLARPVSVTEIHAYDDKIVGYPQVTRAMGARENAARWAALDHCAPLPVSERIGNESEVATWSGCAGGVHVRLVTLAHSSHEAYVNEDGVDVARLIWDTLRGERLPP